jgi:DNA-binding transcriptional ArsR family regulator
MNKADELARIFKLLSVGARVRIILLLKRRSLSVTQITGQLGITQAATSQHLRVLKDAGIVWCLKKGLNIYYSLEKKNIAKINKAVSDLLSINED